MQYDNNGITSKKGYAKIITADFYRRNAETVINSQKSIQCPLKMSRSLMHIPCALILEHKILA